MKIAFLAPMISILLIGVSESDESAGVKESHIELIEQEYREKIAKFDREVRALMIELVKEAGEQTGEKAIEKRMGWFDLKKDEIEEINYLAEILDQLDPLPDKEVRLPVVVGDAPDAAPVNEIREAVSQLMTGKINPEQFEARRERALTRVAELTALMNASRSDEDDSMAREAIPNFEDLEEGRKVAKEEIKALSAGSFNEFDRIAGDPAHPYRTMISRLMEMDPLTRRNIHLNQK